MKLNLQEPQLDCVDSGLDYFGKAKGHFRLGSGTFSSDVSATP